MPWRVERETVPPHMVARSIKSGPLWPNAYLFPHIFICQAPALAIIQGKGESEGEGKRKEKESQIEAGGTQRGRKKEGRKARERLGEREEKRE